MVHTNKKPPPKPRQRKHKPDPWRKVFIETLRNTGNVRVSAAAANVTRKAAYKTRDVFPEFAAEWEEAVEEAIEHLEDVARQRAEESSDTLLIFLLKAHRPEKYREVLNIKVEDLRDLPDAKLEELAARR